jgi:hypothetical protein
MINVSLKKFLARIPATPPKAQAERAVPAVTKSLTRP